MTLAELIHDVNQLIQASKDMNNALESYNDAKDEVKAAAADLASKWEGDAKESFVANQEQAYNWYNQMSDIARAIILSLSKAAQTYQEQEAKLKSIT